jgi:hypothetical protein
MLFMQGNRIQVRGTTIPSKARHHSSNHDNNQLEGKGTPVYPAKYSLSISFTL